MNPKHAFWQALIFTIVVFLFGMLLGFVLERGRAQEIEINLANSELNLLDEQLRNQIIENLNLSCDLAIESTFGFADKIYGEALKLEKYDSASKFTNDLKIIHRRYDLLRTLLWVESIKLKDRCGDGFHTVVYFYEYETQDVGVRSQQIFFSRLLGDIKGGNPEEILLIPIAANLDLESVNIALENYDLTELPVVLIDEERIIDDIITLEDARNIVFDANN